MTNSRLNLGLIFFLFVLFTGMTYADSTINGCGNLTVSGTSELYETYFLGGDITTGSGGSYKILAEEPLEYCFMINASYVILDCNGSTIDTDVDIGILVTDDNFWNQQTGIQIKNCTINNTRFGGIYLKEVNDFHILNNTLINNGQEELRGDLLACTGGINAIGGELAPEFNNFVAYNTLINNTMGICLHGGREDHEHQMVLAENNTIYDSRVAGLVLIEGSWGNKFYNNTIYNNPYGIFMSGAHNNRFIDLNVSNNKYADLMGDPVFEPDGFCTNNFTRVNVTGNKELFVLKEANRIINPTTLELLGYPGGVIPTTQLIVCNDNVTIEDVYMQGDSTYRNNGLFIMGEGRAYNITINNLTATNLMAGVYAQLARNIIIQNSTFENNQYGIIFNTLKWGDFSNNIFNENTAASIFGITSPAYYMFSEQDFSYDITFNFTLVDESTPFPYIYPIIDGIVDDYVDLAVYSRIPSNLKISSNTFTDTGYGPSMREAFPTMSNVPGGFITHFIDYGTGSGIQLVLTKNVTINDNVINNASTYGLFTFYTNNINLSNNEITLVNNVTEFDPYILDFGDIPPEPEYDEIREAVILLKETMASTPGTGIYFDGVNMLSYENEVTGHLTGLISSPISYSIDTLLKESSGGLFDGFLPLTGRNYIINNEFIGSDIGLFLAGTYGDVVYHNKFMDYNYGVQVLSANNVVVDNMFNTTDYFLTVDESYLNTYNASEITEESFLIPFDRNILRGENIGGNYWGLTNGKGHSDTCEDDGNGFCLNAFVLNGTNNTDYKPLAFFSVIDCVDDFECWISVDFGDGFFCNIETECEECDPACDEDQQCVYDPGLDEGVCTDIVQECIDLNDVKASPDGNITNEYGDVRYDSVEDIFYINNNTLLCKKTYTTSTNDIFIRMNGSYELDCNQGLTLDYYMESLTGNAIGIINHYSNVTINNCIFKNFKEGIISTPDPSEGLDTSYGNLLFEETLVSTSDSDVDAFRSMNLFGNYINGVFKVDDKWYMVAEESSNVYSNEDYSYITGWEVDTSKFSGLQLSDDKFVSYNNESMILLDTNTNPLWVKNFIEEEVEVCGLEWETVFSGTSYPFVQGYSYPATYVSDDGSMLVVNLINTVDQSYWGLYKSTDNGSSWIQMTEGIDIRGFDMSSDGSDMIYSKASLYYSGDLGWIWIYSLYISNDSGDTWREVTSNLSQIGSTKITSEGNMLFVFLNDDDSGTSGNFYSCEKTSPDYCDYWGNWTSYHYSTNPYNLFEISDDGEIIVYTDSTTFNIMFSNNSGVSFNLINTPSSLTPYSNIVVTPDGSRIYVVLGEDLNTQYLWYYDTTLLTWVNTNSPIDLKAIQTFSVSQDGQIILLGKQQGNLYLTENGGTDWENITFEGGYNSFPESSMSNDGNVIFLYAKIFGIGSPNTRVGLEICTTETVAQEVVANVYEHPDTGNLYAFVLEEGDAGKTAKIIAYDVSTGVELWNFTPSAPLVSKGKLVFDSEGNVVVPYLYMDDALGRTEILFTLNYTTGELIGDLITFPEDGNYPNGYYSYVFIDSDDYIYDFNLGISQQVKPKAEVSSNESVITLQKYNLTGEDYSNATFVVPYIQIGAIAEAENRRDVNVLFDGEYIYYTAIDSKTGTDRLYYKVFDLNLDEVASGEFKPNYENVEFSSYINENNEVEFLGYFVGNYSYTTSGYNFLAILNKSNDFEFTMLNPVYIQEDYELLTPVHEFVEIDSENNSIVVGYERYPYASKVKLSKFDTEGTLLYNTTYTPNLLGNALPLDFLVNEDGNYLVGGYFVDNELNKKYFVALFNSSDGSVIDYEIIDVRIENNYDLDMLELDDSYTIIVNSNWLYNLTKSDFTLGEIGPFTLGEIGPWGSVTSGLELSVYDDYVSMIYVGFDVELNPVLKLGFYNISLDKLYEPINLGGSESTIENDLPYGVYSFTSEGNNFTYVYFTNINDATGDINSLFTLLVNGIHTSMSEFEDLFIYDVKVNENGEVYILAQGDGDVEGVFVALAEANAKGRFNLTTVSDLDYLFGTKLAVNNDFFTAVGMNVEVSLEGGSFIIGNQDAYVYSEPFEGASSWTHTVLGTSLSSDMEEMLANYYVDAGAVNMYPMGDNYLVSVLRMSQGEGDEPVVKPVFYEVDKYGNYDFLFAFDESYYPAKAIYIDDKIYVLMLNSTIFGETGESGGKYRSLNIGISNYVIYSFDISNYVIYSFDKDGTVNWEVVTDMYNVDFSDFQSLWYYPEPMVYDEVTEKLVIAGASFKIVEECNDKDPPECGPQPKLSNISMGTIDLDGNYASKDLSAELVEYGVQSPINLISGINLADDGYFIVGGMHGGDSLNSYVIKTNKDDFDSPNVKWATTLINGTYGTECVGGWEEDSGFESDSDVRISKDGSKLYYVYHNELYSYDVASSTPSVIVPTLVKEEHVKSGFDMSANGSVMLVAIVNGFRNITWYHATNLANLEDWTIVEGFDNITTNSGSSLVSSDGNTMVIGFDNGTIYRSENGASGPWVKKLDLPEGNKASPYMSGNGETILISYFVSEKNVLNISLNGGDTWNELTLPDDNIGIFDVEITEDGSKVFFVLSKGEKFDQVFSLYTYNVNTEIWEQIGMDLSLNDPRLAISGDGSKILVTSIVDDENTRLYLSEDDGVTWNETQPAGNSEYGWYKPSMSSNGKIIVYHQTYDSFIGDWIKGLYISNETEEEVCESGYVGDPYTYFPIKSFYSEDVESGVLFLTLTNFKVNGTTYNMESPGTLIVDSNNGETLFLFNGAFKKISDKNGVWNSFMYTENYEGMGGVTGYFKVDSSAFTSLATMESALILQGAIIVDNEEYILFDYEPTSYGVMAVGSHFLDGDDQMSSIVQGYSFKTDYDAEDLENITLSNNGILKDDDVLLIDLSSTDSEIDSLLIGRKDMKCAVRFWTINSMSGSLWLNQNLWWDNAGSFISIDSDDANAAAFNVPSRVRLSYTGGTPTTVVGSNESCTTRQCVLDTGANLTGVILSCNTVRKYCEFEVDGWSSYTLGFVSPEPNPNPTSKEDMRLIYNSDMCIGEEYEIKVTDKFDSTIPIKYTDVTIYLNYDKKAELTTNNEGKVFFTPEKVGSYSLKVDATGDYRAILLTENYKFTARDCSLFDVCPAPTKKNYILVVDNPPFDCQYACSITECPDGMDRVDDSLGCRCALLICPDPEENYRFVINDPPTCTYECAIDQAYCDTLGEDYTFNESSCDCDSSGVIIIVIPEYEPDPNKFDLKEGQVCTGGAFTFDVISGSTDFLSNAVVSVFDENGVKIYENVDLSELQPLYSNGTYTFVVSSPGYKTSRLSVEIVDCPEPDIEEPIITPVESSFWDDIINILRTSIKGGCEGFYFEGIPTILCDLVWVVVIVGSIGAAYLEPLKSRKVISLFTPSVVAIVLIPLMGAIAAAVVVYLAYNSKKHVEGKLGHEKEQMEEEIQKD